jgi:hypothetical protein
METVAEAAVPVTFAATMLLILFTVPDAEALASNTTAVVPLGV